ncbi:unnamed protein product, partial [Laminaria digitata]
VSGARRRLGPTQLLNTQNSTSSQRWKTDENCTRECCWRCPFVGTDQPSGVAVARGERTANQHKAISAVSGAQRRFVGTDQPSGVAVARGERAANQHKAISAVSGAQRRLQYGPANEKQKP